MKEGVVSVIVCCFNASGFIQTCFESLLAHTYKRIEVVFVDDGSIDGSLEIAKEYESKFISDGKSLICLRQDNQGAGFACANGLRHATGEYISCFDVDDYLYPESIAKRVSFLESNKECSLVRTNGYMVGRDGKRCLFVTDASEKYKEDIFENLLLEKTNNWSGSYMVRAEVLWKLYPDHRLPGSRYGQNLQILMSVAWHNKAGFIDEPLMEYRFNPNSFTNRETDFKSSYERIIGFKQIRKDILSTLGISDHSLYDKLTLNCDKRIMDLCISHNERAVYSSAYESAASIESPGRVYKYFHYLYSGKTVKASIMRVLLFLQNHLHL